MILINNVLPLKNVSVWLCNISKNYITHKIKRYIFYFKRVQQNVNSFLLLKLFIKYACKITPHVNHTINDRNHNRRSIIIIVRLKGSKLTTLAAALITTASIIRSLTWWSATAVKNKNSTAITCIRRRWRIVHRHRQHRLRRRLYRLCCRYRRLRYHRSLISSVTRPHRWHNNLSSWHRRRRQHCQRRHCRRQWYRRAAIRFSNTSRNVLIIPTTIITVNRTVSKRAKLNSIEIFMSLI